MEQLFDPGPLPPPNPTFGVSLNFRTEIKVDLKRLIREHLDEYLVYKLPKGYEYWEKPLNWLHQYIEDYNMIDYSNSSGSMQERWLANGFDLEFSTCTEEEMLRLHEDLGLSEDGNVRIAVRN